MHAMVLSRFGGPELFEARDIERPTPGPGQLLVRLVASGTNPVDAKLRADGSWAHLQPPVVLGYDGAGVVEEIGVGDDGRLALADRTMSDEAARPDVTRA